MFNCFDSSVNGRSHSRRLIEEFLCVEKQIKTLCVCLSLLFNDKCNITIIRVTTTAKWAVVSANAALNVLPFGCVSVSVCETHILILFTNTLNCAICMSHQPKMHDNRNFHSEKPWLRLVWPTPKAHCICIVASVVKPFSNDNMENSGFGFG